MAAALPFIMAASAVMGAVSSLNQGRAAKDAADYNATVNDQNAAISRTNAQADAAQVSRENYQRLGAIRAAQGHSGGTGDTGSVLDVLGDVAGQGELDRQNAIYGGELKARGYTNTANLDRMSGANAAAGSYLKAGSELLSGAASFYGGSNKLTRT